MRKSFLSVLAVLALVVTPTYALDLPPGAKTVSDQEAVAIFINRELALTIYDTANGEVVGGGTIATVLKQYAH